MVTAFNLIMTAAILTVNARIYIPRGSRRVKALLSGGFALTGLVNLIYALLMGAFTPFCIMMFAGLVFAMLGDIALGKCFPAGAAFFALGHVFYFTAWCLYEGFSPFDLLAALVLFSAACAFLLFFPRLYFPDQSIKRMCLVYAGVISLMAGKAVSGAINHFTASAALAAVGGLLFFFSDCMLVLDQFSRPRSKTGPICLSAYYSAQCILAFSILHAAQCALQALPAG